MAAVTSDQNRKTRRYCPLCQTPLKTVTPTTPVRLADMTLRDAWQVIKDAVAFSALYFFLTGLVLVSYYLVSTATPSLALMNWVVSSPWWMKWAAGTLTVFIIFHFGVFEAVGLMSLALNEWWLSSSPVGRILPVLFLPVLALPYYYYPLITWLVLIPVIATAGALDGWKQRRMVVLRESQERDVQNGDADLG